MRKHQSDQVAKNTSSQPGTGGIFKLITQQGCVNHKTGLVFQPTRNMELIPANHKTENVFQQITAESIFQPITKQECISANQEDGTYSIQSQDKKNISVNHWTGFRIEETRWCVLSALTVHVHQLMVQSF